MPNKKASLYFIDDEPMLEELYGEFCKLQKYSHLGHALTGEEAIDDLIDTDLHPNIILMDYRIPDTNGLKLTKKLLEYDSLFNIIFATGTYEIKKQAMELGAKDFLEKPFRMSELKRKIDAVYTEVYRGANAI